jgi:glutaredoxin 3
MPAITVYTGGFCGYCGQVRALLERRRIAYTEVSVEDHPDLREKLLASSGRRTLPEVYVGERYRGGGAEFAALDRRGKLLKLIEERTADG